MSDVAQYECDRCHRPIGETGRVRRSRTGGVVLTALCLACVKTGTSLRFTDDVRAVRAGKT
jgi:RNase P subunit RPR2